MTDKLLLGILLYKSMTVYEMKKGLERTVGFFSSYSFGSIHPAIRKLATAKLVKGKSFTENGRSKTVYTITDAGREAFRAWLDTRVDPGRIQDDALIRVFFLAELPLSRRLEILRSYVQELREHCAGLKAAQKEHAQVEGSVPPPLLSAYKYRMTTIDYGISFYAFTIKWYTDLIEKIEKGTEL
jgi:DNA-binding PadR family transcriptional regulator